MRTKQALRYATYSADLYIHKANRYDVGNIPITFELRFLADEHADPTDQQSVILWRPFFHGETAYQTMKDCLQMAGQIIKKMGIKLVFLPDSFTREFIMASTGNHPTMSPVREWIPVPVIASQATWASSGKANIVKECGPYCEVCGKKDESVRMSLLEYPDGHCAQQNACSVCRGKYLHACCQPTPKERLINLASGRSGPTPALVVTDRGHDMHVHLRDPDGTDHREIWSAGKTVDEAIGGWMRTHGDCLGIILDMREAV